MSELDSSLPLALVELVQRLLAKDPGRRPGSARAVADALRAIEQGATALQLPGAPLPPSQGASWPLAPWEEDLPSFGEVDLRASRIGAARWSRRRWLLGAGAMAAMAAVPLAWWARRPAGAPPAGDGSPIKVGVLHSTSGTLASSGTALVDATLLAIEQVNQGGGIHGRRVETVFRDDRSDPEVAAREAERLIRDDRVCTIFGCWTSASRKHVRPVVEQYDHLLVYPVRYEGLEQSPNIVYNGATPNQQIIPAVQYCFTTLRKRRFFLVGSDYVFPHTAHAVIKDELRDLGGQVVGEQFRRLGSTDFDPVVAEVFRVGPDMILNTIDGDSNKAFFRALRAAGVVPGKVPTLSFSISEQELRGLDLRDVVGDYAAWNYFQSLDRPENAEFVRRFRARFGAQRLTSDPMESAYTSVHLWAKAVQAAGTDEVKAVRKALRQQGFDAPGGPVRVDPETQHLYKTFRLAQVRDDGQFEVIHSSEKPIRPDPFPGSRTRTEWEKFLSDLRAGWGGQWAKPD